MGIWLKRIGIASIFTFPLAVVLYRLGLVPFASSFSIMKNGAMLGALVFAIGVGYFVFRKQVDPSGARTALIGALIAVIPVIPLTLQAVKTSSLPFIHNVSTDTANAPAFDKILELRTEHDNPHHYDSNQAIGQSDTLGALQRVAYPNVKTHESDLSVADALTKAEAVANALGWEIVNVDSSKGIVEATATSLLWAFKDDIVIRVAQYGEKTLIDLHSVSRLGGSDIGANAARVEKFLAAFSK